jgi:hypothetical protein
VLRGHLLVGEIQLSMMWYIPKFNIPFTFSYRKDVFPHSSQHIPPKSMVTHGRDYDIYLISLYRPYIIFVS